MRTNHTFRIHLAFAGVLTTLGCADDGSGDDEVGTEFDGVYVDCQNANGANFYYQFHIPCPLGGDIEGCYAAIVPHSLETCVGPENIENFTFDEWSMAQQTFPAYDTAIRTLCTSACNNNHVDGEGGSPYPAACSNAGWSGHETKEGWIPAEGYNCLTPNESDPLGGDPYASSIDWSIDGPPLSLPLGCSLVDDCADLFDADIHPWTQIHEFGSPLGAIAFDTRRADYLGSGAGTTLEVDMDAGTGAPYDDHHALDVQAEFSASMCGAATCPFYLANFVASNPSNSWDIWVSWPFVVSEPKQIHNVRIQALRSSMGAWRPSTGQAAFLPGSIVLDVSFDMSSDCMGCSGLGDGHHEFSLSNDSVIFGNFNDGALSLAHSFDIPGGWATLDVQLEASEHPPVAVIGLGSVIHCNAPSGYVLSVDDSAARDPDGDIDYEIWVVDGVAEGNGTIIPLGSHTLSLIVVDDRGAHNAAGERPVEVLPGPACL